MITRTDAKKEYLLKDCDLDERSPTLRYVIRKNPHNPRWGSMKLYLHVQVEERALLVWGSEHALLEERERRQQGRERLRKEKYSRELRALRMGVRSSLYDRSHQQSTSECLAGHAFGPETALPDDQFRATCTRCGYTQTYEKM